MYMGHTVSFVGIVETQRVLLVEVEKEIWFSTCCFLPKLHKNILYEFLSRSYISKLDFRFTAMVRCISPKIMSRPGSSVSIELYHVELSHNWVTCYIYRNFFTQPVRTSNFDQDLRCACPQTGSSWFSWQWCGDKEDRD